jgi:hypothetical protein
MAAAPFKVRRRVSFVIVASLSLHLLHRDQISFIGSLRGCSLGEPVLAEENRRLRQAFPARAAPVNDDY